MQHKLYVSGEMPLTTSDESMSVNILLSIFRFIRLAVLVKCLVCLFVICAFPSVVRLDDSFLYLMLAAHLILHKLWDHIYISQC